MSHEPECTCYSGSCCPWTGDCICQCECDALRSAYERGRKDAAKEAEELCGNVIRYTDGWISGAKATRSLAARVMYREFIGLRALAKDLLKAIKG